MTLLHSRFGFLSLIGTNFISPIVEGFAFRGIFQERLKICGNHLLSVFISAAVFAFVHVFGIDKQFLMILCQGLIFSWLYYKTNQLNYSIAAHILTNVIVTIIHYM